MLEKIKRYALYADVDREDYIQIKPKLEQSNRISAMVFSTVAFVLVSVMMFLSFFQEGFAKSQPVYLFGMIFSVVLFSVSLGARLYPALSYVAVYMAVSVFLVYGIAIGTITRPDQQTVTFMVLLLFLPLIFADRPVRMCGFLLFYIVIFIIAAIHTKNKDVLSVDITDAVIFGILSLVSGTVVIRVKVRGYVLERKLHIMSETDQLTGLNNRNCYEWKLETYPGMCTKSLGCVYVDVNGLHELNNTKGHKAGDMMLQYIAGCVQKQFGFRDTYRIGGDEYVAFAVDIEEEELQEKLEKLEADVAAKKYHAAIGYEIQKKDQLQMNQLIVQAESRMYQNKAEYYQKHDRRAR